MGGQGFEMSFQRQLVTQSWSLFARWRRARSASLLAPDDWIMMTAVSAFYTTLIVCLNIIATGGGSNMYPPEQFDLFTEDEIRERVKGSKIVVISEQAMLNLIWSLKVCMLFMYARMTEGTNHRKWVKYLAIYVAVGWVAVQITFFTACRPFKGYWGMPPPNPQCTTLEHYAIINAVFNLSSDFGMLLLPIPLLISLSLPTKQKAVLAIVFSMGVFVIIAAILTKVYNLSDVYDTAYMLWYTREASVAVYVANLPGIWPLLREHVRFLRNHTSYPHGSALPQYGNVSTMHRSRKQTTNVQADDEIELGRRSFSKSTTRSMVSVARRESEEGVMPGFGEKVEKVGSEDSDERALNEGVNGGSGGWGGLNLEVHVDKTIEVQRVSWDGAAGVRSVNRREQWEVSTTAPKVVIQGPTGEVVGKAG
ncbi:hypothetical protein B0J11DRAFT_607086 [Dendryphion nanum]|uniref:Rhodopsin domain-containing protein n=1 Tax=Dendryphion nanum TaxID=256645 RepID=A0A9P9DS49_9PLEO|nr:hypothetical protein B0J11DRAFT_607086 [Dendryphion nanum]